MGNCADSCRDRKDDQEAAASSKKKDANYMVGGTKNAGFDVLVLKSGHFRSATCNSASKGYPKTSAFRAF